MEIGLAVGGAFLSSALNVTRLLKKLRMTLLGLQAVLSDAENKQASNPYVSQWLNELQDAVHSAENLIEEVNYEVLRLKVEGQHQNFAETSNKENEIEELVGRLTSDDAKSRKLTVIPIVGMAGIGKTTFAKAIYNDESVKTHFDFKAWIRVMLHSKSEVEGWKRILRSEIWELPNNDILAALKLSYNDLPAHLKRCFSYCAIFPKDYPFQKEQVIQLWNANGLVQGLQKDETIEDLGNQYFLELRSRLLFERVSKPSQGNTKKFLMHDLVNDLVQIASSELCIRLEDNKRSRILEKSLHLSCSMGVGDFEKLKQLGNSEQLRTFLPINIQGYYFLQLSKRVLHNILPRLTSLRALSLSRYQIEELPNDLFIKLKLLKFLDLSWTTINKLPDTICVLYNLETLFLSHCYYLQELPLQMEKLIHLCHLDISGTSLLKMPLHLSMLKRLHMLVGAKFLLTGCGSLRIGDLGEVHNLYGSLSILELQNVVDRTEALKANIKEKEHVEKLSLEWRGSIANNSQTERDILDELRPNSNIKELRITGYRGTKLPNWLSDHSFLKLEELSLSNCKDCDSLPALGQLPSLKFLAIRGMHRITEVTKEFYGSSSSRKPFNSLEKLKFADMPELEKWFTVVGSNAEVLTSQLQGMKQIVKLVITDCKSLTSLPISILPSTLKRIHIYHCKKLKLEAPVSEMISDMFLKILHPYGCDSIDDISPELVPRTLSLTVSSCCNLTRLLIPTGTANLNINDCKNLEILSVACGTQMRSLHIRDCKKLKSLPEHMQEILPSLKELTLDKCPGIESFPEGGLPFNLQQLWINNCKKLVNGRKEWHLQRLPCLTVLSIYHDGSDKEILDDENWELPCTIRSLVISNLKTLSSQLLKSLTSIKSLYAVNLPQIQSLLEEGLPSSLSELHLYDLQDLHSLSTQGLCRLTSLQRLEISSCLNLQSLPESGMPPSISTLSIYDCPFLKPLLEFDKGKYWPNISQIPTIYIDGEYL
uniref:Disease resistance protein R3a n=1 Tax=Solanum tuberosum TaxID=4113 RepID=M1CM52_SOLTU